MCSSRLWYGNGKTGRDDGMYLHIGGDLTIRLSTVVAILDMETTTVSKITKEFLRTAEEEGFVLPVSEDLPKSYVITEEGTGNRIYLSPISSATLLKRAEESGLIFNEREQKGEAHL